MIGQACRYFPIYYNIILQMKKEANGQLIILWKWHWALSWKDSYSRCFVSYDVIWFWALISSPFSTRSESLGTSFPRVKHFKTDRRTEETFMCLILPVFCNEALNRYNIVLSEWLFLPIQVGATLLQSRLEDGSIRRQLLPLSAGHQSDCGVSKTIMSLLLVNSMCDWFSQLLSCI